jgi:hypothetical protein
MHTKSHDDWFKHSSNIKGITLTIRGAVNVGITDGSDLRRTPLRCL